MQAVIRGKIYDTDTATKVCDVEYIGRPHVLYKTPNRRYFLAADGGPTLKEPGILALDHAQARHYAEKALAGAPDVLAQFFPIEVA